MENKEHTLTENELKKLPPFTQSLLSHALHERDDFDTPGHHSGAFYEMTEEGNIFTKGLGKMHSSPISPIPLPYRRSFLP